MGKYELYVARFSDVPGWFEENAVALWDALLTYQAEQGLTGDLLEIGVWKGRSAGMIALHAREGERFFLIDDQPLEEAAALLAKAAPRAQYVCCQQDSRAFPKHPDFRSLRGSVRWMHIDGGHSSHHVATDLGIANQVLSAGGVVIVDDFFTPAYPQVTQAVFQYLAKRPKDFALFLAGFNKAYLCRPRAAKRYLEFIKGSLYAEMAARGCAEVTLWKTNTPQEVNAFGITARALDLTYRGLDTDHSEIPI